MVEGDLEHVAALEQCEPSAWSNASITGELHHAAAVVLVICMTGRIVGWGCCRLIDSEAEQLKIAVEPSFKRRGLGSMLLNNMVGELRCRGITEIFLEVRSLNYTARSFYLSHGFTDVSRRINYYRQPTDDALVLKRTLRFE